MHSEDLMEKSLNQEHDMAWEGSKELAGGGEVLVG